MKRRNRVLGWFIQGIMVVTPVALTLYLIWALFSALNHLLFTRIGTWLTGIFHGTDTSWVVTILGIITTLFIFIFIGAIASNFIGRKLVQLPARIMNRMPLIKLLYNGIQDIFQAIMGDKKKFDRPVLVQVQPNISIAGFITSSDLSDLGLADKVAVYLPQSFNFAGNTIIVTADSVTPLHCNSSELLSFIVSGGITTNNADEKS